MAAHQPDQNTHDAGEHEKPEDWGWHAEMGRGARVAGWLVVAVLLVMNIGNQTRHIANFWLTGIALFLAIILLVDRHRRKNSWRE